MRFAALVRLAAIAAAAVEIATLVPAAAAPPGDPVRGRHVFETKYCARCHRPDDQARVGPALEVVRRPQGAYEFSGRLWNHAPAMLTLLRQQGLSWPLIEPDEMADLMVFLLADPALDPTPDRARGLTVLVRKGCLKCHSYRREGGRIGPDLAERQDRLAPPSTWAATVWTHAPTMAATAIQHGLLYPRFTDDEMVHLLGVLRSGEVKP